MTSFPKQISPFSSIPQLNAALILKEYGLHAKKNLGQNFLQDPSALIKITETSRIEKTDSVLEIGTGLGSLTRYLSICSQEVVSVELDEKFIPILQILLHSYPNVRLIHGDILKLNPENIGLPQNYIVTANIPYNITSAIIRHLLESLPRPRRIVLTVQKEIAERICENPPDMSLLALSVQVYGKASIAAFIPAGAFYPAPKIDSAIVRIEVYPSPLIPAKLLDQFFLFTKAGFSQKRKTLRNALSGGLQISAVDSQALLERAGIDPGRRAETLSLEEWGNLCKLGPVQKPE